MLLFFSIYFQMINSNLNPIWKQDRIQINIEG